MIEPIKYTYGCIERSYVLVTFTHSGDYQPVLDAHLHLTHHTEHAFPGSWYFFTNSATPDEWQLVDRIASDRVFPFYGIHPECGPGPIDDLGWEHKIEQLRGLNPDKPAGIGECGIDKRYYDAFSKHEQIQLCRRQITAAQKTGRPLSLHQVHASQLLLDLIRELDIDIRWMMHGFFGSPETARQILDLGGYVSLGPNLLRSPKRMDSLAAYIPSDRLLLETDWPYTVIPKQWNISAYPAILLHWYETLAVRRGIDTDSLIDIVLTNGKIFTDFTAHR